VKLFAKIYYWEAIIVEIFLRFWKTASGKPIIRNCYWKTKREQFVVNIIVKLFLMNFYWRNIVV